MRLLQYQAAVPLHEVSACGDSVRTSILRTAYRALADEMHKHAIVSVQTIKPDDDAPPYHIGTELHRFSVFVETDKAKAQGLADEIEAARQQGFAHGAATVAEVASVAIRHWGSAVGVTHLTKAEAESFIYEALRAVLPPPEGSAPT